MFYYHLWIEVHDTISNLDQHNNLDFKIQLKKKVLLFEISVNNLFYKHETTEKMGEHMRKISL